MPSGPLECPVRGWVPRAPDPGVLADVTAPIPSWSDPAPDGDEARQERAAVSVLGLLRSGRVDPGRRGVLALVGVGLMAAVVAGAVLLRARPSEQPLVVPAVAGAGSASRPDAGSRGVLVVDVTGRVRHPGIVKLPDGSRVDDALRAAGGLLPGASTGLLNLAQKVMDGQQVLVGVPPATVAASGTVAGSGPTGGLLDLNAATVSDLDGLPGVGPVLAQRILDWRTEHARFASVDQLREVSGIGEAKYSSLKAKVRV
ncbi:MAG: helix-hairpin-helix domain-containing protein [Pseudorhodobacter sp.]|nr:helix-hairpin-helix domain-containing protein [Frankiaceae bacterium]